MQYTEYYNIERFLKITEKTLLDNEIVNGLIYGIAETLKTDMNYYGSDPLLATVSTDSSVELVIMMTPPYKIQILAPGKNRGEALDLLSKKLKENNWSVPAVIAEKEIAKSFSAKYCKFTDKKFKKTMSLRIYELTKVSDISLSEGKMRVATMDDYDLVFKWTKAFEKDCFGDTDVPEETQHLVGRLKTGKLYIWETDKPVSMAARIRPTPHGESVNLVYTPPEFRKKGYATAVVSKLSQIILDSGKKFCTLFTDLANPTSNSIYQKIGYRPVADVVDYVFEK